MARKNLQETVNEPTEASRSLDALIPRYAVNKEQMDELKKVCDVQNKEIKELMLSENLDLYTSKGYKATKFISKRESFNEAKLLKALQDVNIDGLIKTKQYVDMDVLESALYRGQLSEEVILTLDKCKEVKEVVTLKITKVKEKK